MHAYKNMWERILKHPDPQLGSYPTMIPFFGLPRSVGSEAYAYPPLKFQVNQARDPHHVAASTTAQKLGLFVFNTTF